MGLRDEVLEPQFEALARDVEECPQCLPQLFADADGPEPQAGLTVPAHANSHQGQQRHKSDRQHHHGE